MTTGIYGFYWDEGELYIGKSENIERRFRDHISHMISNSHHSYKVQQKYTEWAGILPDLFVIEKCSISELVEREKFYIKKYNSYFKGLNCTIGGDGRSDPGSNNSKYSRIQILKVFSMLLSKTRTTDYIRKRTKVNISTIKGIKSCRQHLWLQDLFKDKYAQLSNSGHRTSFSDFNKGLDNKLLGPDGIIYTVTNLRQFVLERPDLVTSDRVSISKILREIPKYKSCKGYTKYIRESEKE